MMIDGLFTQFITTSKHSSSFQTRKKLLKNVWKSAIADLFTIFYEISAKNMFRVQTRRVVSIAQFREDEKEKVFNLCWISKDDAVQVIKF